VSGLFDTCYRKRIDFASMARITDFRFGKVLPVYMQAVGLVEMGNEAFVRCLRGGDPFARMWIKPWERIDEAVIAKRRAERVGGGRDATRLRRSDVHLRRPADSVGLGSQALSRNGFPRAVAATWFTSRLRSV
jgi:hypothetical protein